MLAHLMFERASVKRQCTSSVHHVSPASLSRNLGQFILTHAKKFGPRRRCLVDNGEFVASGSPKLKSSQLTIEGS